MSFTWLQENILQDPKGLGFMRFIRLHERMQNKLFVLNHRSVIAEPTFAEHPFLAEVIFSLYEIISNNTAMIRKEMYFLICVY